MNPDYNPEYEAKCRAKLESLGFELVKHTVLWATTDGTHIIDFSAIDPEKYVEFACREMFNMGYADGEKHIQDEMNRVLGR